MIDLPTYVTKALQLLESAGFCCWLVGGCVRDSVMGAAPHDYDAATCALPEQIKRCFAGYRIIETGVKHGTVTVLIDSRPIEITTFRVDGEYEDNRRPKSVSFTARLEDDLARRDFSINAMAYNPKHGLVDPYGGAKAIKDRIIACVGDPNTRFCEDALRIMRALRFSSRLGFAIEEKTRLAMLNNAHLLKNISAERIYSELKGMLLGKNTDDVIENNAKVLSEIIPEIAGMEGFEQHSVYHCYDVLRHTAVSVGAVKPIIEVRLALLFHDIGKPETFFIDERGGHFYGHAQVSAKIAKNTLERLRAERNTIETVVWLVENHDKPIEPDERRLRRMLAKSSYRLMRLLIEVKRGDRIAHAPDYRSVCMLDEIDALLDKLEAEEACVSLHSLAIGGEDLIALGMSPGRRLGAVLDRLLEQVLEGGAQNTREELLKAALDIIENEQTLKGLVE